ncbi:hypothetical protein H4R34_000523 [Dimargaris verticillata]|uniref:GLTSCR protein conserved domain-containing protein n=1 Tax=Dimargaris verticillata TaxID=2761393 RepID=A0A9W8BCF2_9FUNG|nr:hypothetical protein H4R34_000523 [Dimargaris verticillata]
MTVTNPLAGDTASHNSPTGLSTPGRDGEVVQSLTIEGVNVVAVRRGDQMVYKLANNMAASSLTPERRRILVERLRQLHANTTAQTPGPSTPSANPSTPLATPQMDEFPAKPWINDGSSAVNSGSSTPLGTPSRHSAPPSGSLAAILADHVSRLRKDTTSNAAAASTTAKPAPPSVSPLPAQQATATAQQLSEVNQTMANCTDPAELAKLKSIQVYLSARLRLHGGRASGTASPQPGQTQRALPPVGTSASLPVSTSQRRPSRSAVGSSANRPKTKRSATPPATPKSTSATARTNSSTPGKDMADTQAAANFWAYPTPLSHMVNQFATFDQTSNTSAIDGIETSTYSPEYVRTHFKRLFATDKHPLTEAEQTHRENTVKRIKLSYAQDMVRALALDTETPFTSLPQAIDSLLPFHLYQHPDIDLTASVSSSKNTTNGHFEADGDDNDDSVRSTALLSLAAQTQKLWQDYYAILATGRRSRSPIVSLSEARAECVPLIELKDYWQPTNPCDPNEPIDQSLVCQPVPQCTFVELLGARRLVVQEIKNELSSLKP